MRRLKFYIINTIIIFLLASLCHFGYTILPNYITAIFFPVNESIWEHMKLFYTPYMIDILILYIYFEKSKILYHNYLISGFISSIFSIFLYLLIYLPLFNFMGNNTFINIFLMIIIIFISQIILLNILKKEEIKFNNFFCIFIIIGFIVFSYLTYNPIHNYIFYDFKYNKFGRNIYILGN